MDNTSSRKEADGLDHQLNVKQYTRRSFISFCINFVSYLYRKYQSKV